MSLKKKEYMAGYIFVLPCLMGYFVFFAIPFVVSLYYSFTKGIGAAEFVGFDNFINLLNSESFRLAAKNTIKFNLVSVPLVMITSLAFALLLNSKLRGVSYFRKFFILPLVIPVASVVLFWQIFFDGQGVLNGILSIMNIQPVDWLNSNKAFYILVLLYIWKNCGYNIILFLAGLNNIPSYYYEAAYIDGCGKVRAFFKITLYFLQPTIFFVFIISIINSFKVYREAFSLAGAYPHSSIYMLQHFMNNNFYNLNYQRLSTSAFLVFILIIILVYILFKFKSRYEIEY